MRSGKIRTSWMRDFRENKSNNICGGESKDSPDMAEKSC